MPKALNASKLRLPPVEHIDAVGYGIVALQAVLSPDTKSSSNSGAGFISDLLGSLRSRT